MSSDKNKPALAHSSVKRHHELRIYVAGLAVSVLCGSLSAAFDSGNESGSSDSRMARIIKSFGTVSAVETDYSTYRALVNFPEQSPSRTNLLAFLSRATRTQKEVRSILLTNRLEWNPNTTVPTIEYFDQERDLKVLYRISSGNQIQQISRFTNGGLVRTHVITFDRNGHLILFRTGEDEEISFYPDGALKYARVKMGDSRRLYVYWGEDGRIIRQSISLAR